MRNEYKIQVEQIIKLACVVVFAALYALGGIHFKWLRRFVAPAWLGGCMFYFCRDWKVFLYAVFQSFGFHMGYGSHSVGEAIVRRALYGTINGVAAVPLIFTKRNAWIIVFVHFGFCVISSIVFGAFNPFGSARAEELVLGFIYGFLPMFTPNDKGE